jgi:hypothetical protein
MPLEKYKSMARDAQLAGDRVQTEYYLQFADHYFRVLSENRSRFEEQNPRRSRDEEMDEDEGEADGELVEAGEESSNEDRPERGDRQDRGERQFRNERFNRQSRPRSNGSDDSLPLDVLPPAIGREPQDSEAEASDDEQPRKPRRRARPPRAAEGDDEIAPAA